MADVQINVKVVSGAAEAAVKSLGSQTQKTEKAFDQLQVSVKNTTSAFAVFAGNLAADAVKKFASTVLDLSKASLNATIELEKVSTQFEVLTGSASVAKDTIKDLQKFAASTPFQFQDIAKATAQLISFGFGVDEAKNKLQGIGDVAAASNQSLGEISLIFGQVAAAGKLTGERLLQFQERAIPVGPAIAKTMGVAESAVKDLVSQGKVDFATFEKAFQSLSKEGGFAFEGMIKQSKTLGGRISTFKDNVELLATSFGSALAPAAKAVIQAVTEMIDRFSKGKDFGGFLQATQEFMPKALSILATSLSTTVTVFGALISGGAQVTAFFAAMAQSVLQGAIALNNFEKAVKGALGFDTTNLDAQNRALEATIKGLEDFGVSSLEFAAKVDSAQVTIQGAISETHDLAQQYYREEVVAANQTANATEIAAQKKIEAERAATKASELALQRKREQAQLEIDDINKVQVLKDQVVVNDAARRELVATEEDLFAQTRLLQLQDELAIERESRLIQQSEIIGDAVKHAELLAKIRADQSKRQLDIEKAEVEARKAIDKQREANQKDTLSTIASLAQSGNKELALIGKAAGIAQIAIDTPVAISKALASAPPPFNYVLAGAVGAAMAAQAAKIAGLNFASGGIVPGTSFTGDKVAANVNSGEMILNRQQQANLFDMANRGGGAGPQEIIVHTTVELDGSAIGKSVSRQVADGLKLGEVV